MRHGTQTTSKGDATLHGRHQEDTAVCVNMHQDMSMDGDIEDADGQETERRGEKRPTMQSEQ